MGSTIVQVYPAQPFISVWIINNLWDVSIVHMSEVHIQD